MSVSDKTRPGQANAIELELDLHQPPKKVWRALTEPALLAKWLLPALGHSLEPGARFRFQAEPQPGWDGTVHCQVRSVEAERQLSYHWVVGDLDTVVTFTLEPTAAGTRLSIVQTGFKPEQKRNFGGARYGWRLMGDRLVALLS